MERLTPSETPPENPFAPETNRRIVYDTVEREISDVLSREEVLRAIELQRQKPMSKEFQTELQENVSDEDDNPGELLQLLEALQKGPEHGYRMVREIIFPAGADGEAEDGRLWVLEEVQATFIYAPSTFEGIFNLLGYIEESQIMLEKRKGRRSSPKDFTHLYGYGFCIPEDPEFMKIDSIGNQTENGYKEAVISTAVQFD